MSLLCGGCQRDIYGEFSFLFLLDKKVDGRLATTHKPKEEERMSANCAICSTCSEGVEKVGKKSSEGMQTGCVLLPVNVGIGGKALFLTSHETDLCRATYLDSDYCLKRWPFAMKIIERMALRGQAEMTVRVSVVSLPDKEKRE